jgi:hypothetical protein
MSTVNTQPKMIQTAEAPATAPAFSRWNHIGGKFQPGIVPALAMRCAP